MRTLLVIAIVVFLSGTACNQLPSGGDTGDPSRTVIGSPEEGRKLVTEKGCIACHTISSVPNALGAVGPVLDGVGDPTARPKIADGRLDNTPENIKTWLSDPPAVKSNTAMPNLGLSPQEIAHLAAFLQTLK